MAKRNGTGKATRGGTGRAAAAGSGLVIDSSALNDLLRSHSAGMNAIAQTVRGNWRDLQKAGQLYPPPANPPRSYTVDPFSLVHAMGWKERLSNVTDFTLKEIESQIPVLRSIVNVRTSQVEKFFDRYSETRSGVGFSVKPKDKLDGRRSITRPEMAQARVYEDFILRCGRPKPNRLSTVRRDTILPFIRKVMRDSLILDKLCAEKVPDAAGGLYEVIATDASTIKVALDQRPGMPYGTPMDRNRVIELATMGRRARFDDAMYSPYSMDGNPTAYVQVIHGQITTVYSDRQMMMKVRWPRTDIHIAQYGFPEAEQAITAITSILYQDQYQRNIYKGAQKGLLAIKGQFKREAFNNFRRHYAALGAGVENSYRTGALQLDSDGDAKWIDMHRSEEDTKALQWSQFLIQVFCFTPESMVVLPDGRRARIDAIEPGDLVRTHKGHARPVRNVQISQYHGPLVRLAVANGRTFRATPEHPFYVAKRRVDAARHLGVAAPQWTKAKDIEAGDQLFVPRPRIPETHARIDLAVYVPEAEVTPADMVRLPANRAIAVPRYIELTDENAFVLGLYAADGHSSNGGGISFTFGAAETEYANAVEQFAARIGLTTHRVPMEAKAIKVGMSSALLARALRMMFGATQPERLLPVEIRESSVAARRAFLSGLIAGDGSVYRGSSGAVTVQLTTCSPGLAEQAATLLMADGVLPGMYASDRRARRGNAVTPAHVHYDLRVNARPRLERIAQWLSGPKGERLRAELDAMPPKIHIHSDDTETGFFVAVLECESEEYDGPVYNLEVEEDSTYVVEDAAVHNCGLFLIEPEEISLHLGSGSAGNAPMFQASADWKLKASRDRGLPPLLAFLATVFQEIVEEIDDVSEDFAFCFEGLDQPSREQKHKEMLERVATVDTLNEVRASEGKPPVKYGDIPLSGTYVQYALAQEEREMMQAGLLPEPGAGGPADDGEGAKDDAAR